MKSSNQQRETQSRALVHIVLRCVKMCKSNYGVWRFHHHLNGASLCHMVYIYVYIITISTLVRSNATPDDNYNVPVVGIEELRQGFN